MKIIKIVILVSISFLTAVPASLFAQETSVISPYLLLQYFKNSDDQRSLKATLTYSVERIEYPLPGKEISFYSGGQDRQLLGTVLTDEKGNANFIVTGDMRLPVDNEGQWNFSTEFSGNDTIEAISSDLLIKDVKLEMSLTEADSIKTISLKAYTSENNKEIPVKDEMVMVYVPRMFSLLPVGEAYLDENGTASLEFPTDLPGDSIGNITIISKFEDHASFGNVERVALMKWGVPSVDTAPVAHRALWTKTPPMWMIITLSILLTGVWGHYLFAVISLIRIKMESKKEKKF